MTVSFWSDDMDLSMYRHGSPMKPHTYAGGGTARGQRECTICHQWRPPVCESITCHPVDRPYLNEQLPTARVYGEPLPEGCLILESTDVTPLTLRVRIEGRDMVVTLGQAPEPRWVKCDPVSGVPIGALR